MLIGVDASRSTAQRLTGTERYSREVIAELMRLGSPQHKFRLYTRSAENPIRIGIEYKNTKVAQLAPPRLWTHLALGPHVLREPPDALFIPAHVLPIQFWRRRARPRTVVTIHDLGYRHFPQAHPLRQRLYLDLATRFSAQHADALIVDSSATLEDVARAYAIHPTKMHVAHPGHMPLVELSDEQIKSVIAEFGLSGREYVLFVGTLQPRKNLSRLIEAWRILSSEFQVPSSQSVLVIAGGRGWGADIAQTASERVIFTGYVSDAQKSTLMRRASVFAFPSLYEGFGFPVLEAQSVGVPVVCSNTSSLPEVAGDAAEFVDPLSVESIANGLRRALTDAALRARLSAQGYLNVQRFTWNNSAEEILSVIENR